jgi:hypothetical protein
MPLTDKEVKGWKMIFPSKWTSKQVVIPIIISDKRLQTKLSQKR